MKTQNTKHKTLIVLLCLTLFTNGLIAQVQSLVSVKPIVGQGYLILDKMNNPNVDSWGVQIKKIAYNSDGVISDEIISTETLPSGINYLFIPVEYRKQSFIENYVVTVRGFGNDGAILVSEENIQLNDNNGGADIISENGGTPYFPTDCRKTCISGQYAYNIQQYQQFNVNLSRFQLEEAYKAFDPNSQTANPYYWYSNQNLGVFANPIDKISFVVNSGPGNMIVKDPAGNILTGTIYGYRKKLGPWVGQSIIMTNGNHNIGSEFCGEISWSLNTAINLMNGSADFTRPNMPDYPFLDGTDCKQSIVGPPGPGNNDPFAIPLALTDFVSFTFCFQDGLPVPCPTTPSIPLPIDQETVDAILISDLNNPHQPPIQINTADLYDPNGNFLGLNLNLSPGLYSFGFFFVESGLWNAVGEIMTQTNFSTSQADMLEANVFPTPMTGDKYTIDMKAHATLKFDYELRDFTGELLVSKKFVLHKDHEKSQNMNEKNIPEGFLVHRFVFEDGSVKTIQTIKN